MTKRYVIKVLEIGQEPKIVGGTWQRGAGKTPEEYGHTPQIEMVVDYEREIYEQTVAELDVPAVIRAVLDSSR